MSVSEASIQIVKKAPKLNLAVRRRTLQYDLNGSIDVRRTDKYSVFNKFTHKWRLFTTCRCLMSDQFNDLFVA